jgi:hypothetical protein
MISTFMRRTLQQLQGGIGLLRAYAGSRPIGTIAGACPEERL